MLQAGIQMLLAFRPPLEACEENDSCQQLNVQDLTANKVQFKLT